MSRYLTLRHWKSEVANSLGTVVALIGAQAIDAAGPFRADRNRMRELADIGAGDERLVPRSGENDAAHRGVIPRILEGRAQILPGGRVERVEHLRTVERHV